MSSHDEDRSPLDRAIDGAVRHAVQRDPAAHLTQRVMRRIAAPRRHAWVPLIPVLVTTAAVILVAAVLFRGPDLPAVPATQVASVPAAEAAAAAPTLAPAATERADPISTAPAARAADERGGAPTSESIFGPRTGRVGAASVSPGAAVPGRSVELQLIVADGLSGSPPDVVTRVMRDRVAGEIRSARPGAWRVGVRPEVLQSGSIRVGFELAYGTADASGTRPEWAVIERQGELLLQPGERAILAEAREPGSDRRVVIEIRGQVVQPPEPR